MKQFLGHKPITQKGIDFSVYEKKRRIHVDFDLKRKPVIESAVDHHFDIPLTFKPDYQQTHEKYHATVATLETKPYHDVEEFYTWRDYYREWTHVSKPKNGFADDPKGNGICLRTKADWFMFKEYMKRGESNEQKMKPERYQTRFVKSCLIYWHRGYVKMSWFDALSADQRREWLTKAGCKEFTVSMYKKCTMYNAINTALPWESVKPYMVNVMNAQVTPEAEREYSMKM